MLDATSSRSTGLPGKRLQKRRRAQIVDTGVFGNLVHALADTDQRDKVNHHVNVFKRAAQSGRVPNVADDQFHVRRKVGRTRTTVAVDLWNQAVDSPYSVPVRKEFVRNVGAYKTRAACDKYPFSRQRFVP